RLNYLRQVDLAFHEYRGGNLTRALELLEASDPRLRHWEWAYVRRLCVGRMRELRGHTRTVHCVAFSADGQRIASASEDRTIKVWDAHAGQELLSLKGHGDGVTSVAFSPDGKRLASTSADRTARVWDAI